MFNFSEFYQNGGVLMHVITVFAAIGFTTVLLHGRARRLGDDDPRRILLADRMASLCLAVGVLGSLFGLVEMCAALTMIDPGEVLAATLRAGMIVPITLEWALMCAIPIWIATGAHRSVGPIRAGARSPS